MAWIEAHDTLPDHPKVLRAAKMLRLDSDALVGKLLRLWTWALSNREDGILSDLDAGVLHRIMNYGGKAGRARRHAHGAARPQAHTGPGAPAPEKSGRRCARSARGRRALSRTCHA